MKEKTAASFISPALKNEKPKSTFPAPSGKIIHSIRVQTSVIVKLQMSQTCAAILVSCEAQRYVTEEVTKPGSQKGKQDVTDEA